MATQIMFYQLFSPNGKYLSNGTDDHSIKLYNLQERREEFNLSGHLGYAYSVAFSPDGKFLASGSSDKIFKLSNLQDKK